MKKRHVSLALKLNILIVAIIIYELLLLTRHTFEALQQRPKASGERGSFPQ